MMAMLLVEIFKICCILNDRVLGYTNTLRKLHGTSFVIGGKFIKNLNHMFSAKKNILGNTKFIVKLSGGKQKSLLWGLY